MPQTVSADTQVTIWVSDMKNLNIEVIKIKNNQTRTCKLLSPGSSLELDQVDVKG